MKPTGDPAFELRIYSRRVTWGVVFVCFILFLGGIHLSGIDLERIDRSARTFSPGNHECVRSEVLLVSGGSPDSFDLCVEWIDLNDTSGRIHHLNLEDLDIRRGPKGEILVREKNRINFPLLGLLSYLIFLIFAGNAIQTKLIGRRRRDLEAREPERGSGRSI